MKPALLTVNSLSFERAGRRLLNNISFEITPGEVVGVIGPNGAGKSTLLKTVVHYLPATTGDVLLSGHSVSALSDTARAAHVSYLAQHTQVSFAFTVKETIALGAHQLHAEQSNAQIQESVNHIANQLDIAHLLARKIDTLSGGETQLVHFARTLMQQAPLMLLDEPTASLDMGHEAHLMNSVRKQCRTGSSALVAIHNLNVAAAFCDRLLLLNQGELIADGRPEEVITTERMDELYPKSVIVSEHPVAETVAVFPLANKVDQTS